MLFPYIVPVFKGVRFEWGYRERKSEPYEARRRFQRSDSRLLRPAKADSDRRGPQRCGTAPAVHWSHRARDSDHSLYLSRRNHSDHRRRLLAERQENLLRKENPMKIKYTDYRKDGDR